MAYPFQSTGLFGRPAGRSPSNRRRRLRGPARWFWRNAARSPRANVGHERLIFDPLEPRLLLNADVLSINLAHDLSAPPADQSLIVQMVQATEQVNNQTVTVQRVQVVDQSDNNAVLAFGDLNEISAVSIQAGNTSNTITIDANSFAGQKTPTISIDGGSGQNNIIFDNSSATNWTLTGQNSGTVTGNGVTASFENVDNLTGGGTGANTLTVDQGGTLSGVFDGGASGANTLNVSGFEHQDVAVSSTPQYDTLTLDGQAYNYTDVQAIMVGDPVSESFTAAGSSDVIDMTQVGGQTGTLSFTDTTNSNFSLFLQTPTSGTSAPFDVTLGSGQTLDIGGTVDFSHYDTGLDITGAGTVELLAGSDLVVPDGVSISATTIDLDAGSSPTGGAIISSTGGSNSVTGANSVTLDATATATNGGPAADAGINVGGVTTGNPSALAATISANTIELESSSTSTTTINASSTDTSATINTTNSATIGVYGTLDATGALSVLTGVTVNDQVNANDGPDLTAITIVANDTSVITLGSKASLTGSSVDIAATTNIDPAVNSVIPVMVTADDLADSFLDSASTIIPSSVTGTLVKLQTAITNTTEVTIPATAVISAGSGTVAGSTAALVISATDTTNAIVDFQPATTDYLPLLNGLLLFSTVDSQIAVDRTTEVLIGDTNQGDNPTAPASDTIDADGDADISASSSGSIANNETSDVNLGSAVGSTETYAEGFTVSGDTVTLDPATNGDTTLVELRGVSVNFNDNNYNNGTPGGLDVTALSDTSYLSTSHYVTNTVYGETEALLENSDVDAGADGFSLESTDNSALTAIAQSFDINTEHVTGIDTFTVTVSATTAVNAVDKNVETEVAGSTVNSNGEVLVQALDSETIVSFAETETVVITTTPLDKGYFEFGGTFAANSVLGGTTATIDSSSVTTKTADSTNSPNAGDVQVLAGNTSTIDAEAQAGTTATGGSLAAGVAGALAFNSIGFSGNSSFASLASQTGTVSGQSTGLDALEAAINGLLGTSFWSTETPSNVTASVVSSTVDAAGALLLMSVAEGVINATVSNVSDVTGSAIGGTKTGAAGGIIATNKLSGQAQAYIDNSAAPSDTVMSGGATTVEAQNNDTINSNSTIITDADATTDGAATLASEALSEVLKLANAATYKSSNPTQNEVLYYGDTVQFVATYNTARSLFAPLDTALDVTLQTGDTVYVEKGYDPLLGTVGVTYVYIGTGTNNTGTIQNFNLENANYLDTANWAVANGQQGAVYKFMGPSQTADPSGTQVDLGTGVVAGELQALGATETALGYANLNWWYEEPYSQLLPSGYNIKSATGIAVGGIVVTNDVKGGATAYVQSATLNVGSLNVTANDNAGITATVNATASASGGTVFGGEGSGTVLAVNAAIATNQVIGAATAYISNSSVTTSETATDSANDASPDVTVDAINSDSITATTTSSTTVGGNGSGTAVGIVLAFNAIGDAFNNLLSNTVDALLDQTVLGDINAADTTAYISDSAISMSSGGALTVSASSTETVSSTISDNATSDAAAFANASGTTVDGLLTSNVIQAGVSAYIDNNSDGKSITDTGGAVSVTATDNSSDTATSSETSINMPTNDGGAGLINGYANLVLDSYQYTDESGVQNLSFGDKVWVDTAADGTTGSIYEYMGPGGTIDTGVTPNVTLPTDSVDLSTGAAASGNNDGNTGYVAGAVDTQYWKLLSQNNIMQQAEIDVELGIVGEVTKNEDIQGSANGYFGLLDFNEVQSSTSAYIQNIGGGAAPGADLSGASVSIEADDSASITAADASTVTASSTGGNNGGGTAFGGVIATNQVDGDASAYIDDATVKATAGDVTVTADTTASITALETSSLSAGGNTGSILAAFNVIGWSKDNFAYLLVGSLIGDTNLLGDQTPDLTQAYIQDSVVTASANVKVMANDSASITVDAGDAANTSQGNNLLFAFEDGDPGISADGLVATNMIAAQTSAYIANGAGLTSVTAATGSVVVNALDNSSDTATSALNVVATNTNNESDIVAILDQVFTTSYAYTGASGWQSLNTGDEVLDDSNPNAPAIYKFTGTSGTLDDLSNETFTSGDWSKQTEGEPTVAGELAAFGQFNLTASNAKGLGGLVIMNEVQSQTTATVTGATLSAGDGINVAANESAAIVAFAENNVTSSGGSAGLGLGGEGATNGGSLAADGTIVTNLIDASATAYVDRSQTPGSNYLTTPGSDPSANVAPYTNVVNLSDGDVITLGDGTDGYPAYGAVTGNDVVGSGSASATINPGDVVQNGSSYYRYLGASALTLDLAHGAAVPNFNTASWAQVGGAPDATYEYIGPTGNVDIYNSNYANTSLWQLTNSTTPSSGVHNNVNLTTGNTVQLASNYDVVTPGDQVGFGAADTPVDTGDVIADGTYLYRYIGASPINVDFSSGGTVPNFASDHSNWAQIGGSSGAVYQYIGTSPASFDLNNTDYNNAADWAVVSNTSTTPGPNPPSSNLVALTSGQTVQLAGNYDTVASGDVVGSGSANTAVNAGDVIQDGSTLYRYIGPAATTVDFANGGTLPNFASDSTDWAVIGGTNGAVYQYTGPAANVDLYNTNYASSDWTLVTPTYTDASLSAGSGGISVTANNAAQLDAQVLAASATSGGGNQTSVGAVLAFNALGYDPENFLFNSIDALLGDAYLANADPSNATAYIHDTTITTTSYGDLDVEAQSLEQITATNSNAASSAASALFDANGDSYGFSLASNKVDGSATAYIDESDLTGNAANISVAGSLSVLANDDAGIYSNVKLVSSATVTSDGGAGLLQTEINASTPATYSTAPDTTLFPSDTATSVTRTLAFGDTVNLDNGVADGLPAYDAVTTGSAADGTSLPDIVGSGAPGTTVSSGDVVQSAGGTLYRYIGGGAVYDFSPQALSQNLPNFSDTNSWAQIGGTPGVIYEYMGTGGQVNLATTDYTDLELWKPLLTTQLIPQGLNVTASSPTAVGAIAVLNSVVSATTAYVNDVKITTGGTIAINAVDEATITANNDSTVSNSGGSATGEGTEWSKSGIIATNLVQSSASAYAQSSTLTSNSKLYILGSGGTKTLNPGDVVEENASSAPADFTTNSTNGGSDLAYLVAGETVQLDSGYGAVTDTVGSSGPDVTVSGGDVVQNGTTLYRYIGSAAQAYDLTGNVDDTNSADPSPDFTDTTTWVQIGGTAGALYEYIGAGSAQAPQQTDLNNTDYTDATNWQLVQPALYRYIGNSPLTNFSLAQNAPLPQFGDATQWVQIGAATISIYATNTSTITADNEAQTSSGGNGISIVLAFNTIGWQSQNFLFNAVDAILGSPDIDEAFGSSPLADVTAYSSDSTLDATSGSISVEATEQAIITATTGNSSNSLASGLEGENSESTGGLIATNMVNAQATAYITSTTTTQDATAGGGGISVIAQDDAEVHATNDQQIMSTSVSSPQGLLESYLANVLDDYQFTSASGTQGVNSGDLVYNGADGNIYEYTPATQTQTPVNLNLGDYDATSNPNGQQYGTSSNWTQVDYSSLASDIPGFNLTDSNAEATGAIAVLNDVRSTVSATVTNGALSAAGVLAIEAQNNAIIDADNTSTVIASGGSPISPDGSADAKNFTVASNYVLASTIASATGTTLTTTSAGGNVDISAVDNASIDAEMDASTFANDSTVGVILAFNTIGYNEPELGFLGSTVDALFGTDLAGTNPDKVEAYADNTSISSDGGVDVSAEDTANITADVSNASLGVPTFLTGGKTDSLASGGGISVGATIALNAIDTDIEAYVTQTGTSDTVSATGGDIDITSSDNATIDANVVTPVVKIGVSFSNSASDAIGVSIVRNIVDSNVAANDGGRVIGGTTQNPVYDNGLNLTTTHGN
ncbi:MAG TPA: LEPR-XLL domain-containing protein, partial [Xanthobacteraceae bacterium]